MDTKAFFDMSYGLYILGVMDGNRPTGCTVNTVFQITSDPPVMAISCNHQNFTNEVIKRTRRVAVAILDQDTPLDTIGGFGFRSGREVDKFDGVEFVRTSGGLPVPKEHLCGWLECQVEGSFEGSTHTVFFARVVDCVRTGGGTVPPMTYALYHDVKNGKTPPTAPHYQPEEPKAAEGKWICPFCGYQYDGDVPFEELPDDWKCPMCGQPKRLFEKR